jgi:hypothetical protein
MASEEADLAHWLDSPALVTSPRGCLVTIKNSTSPDKEALIVGAGARFLWQNTVHSPLAQPPTRTIDGDYLAGPVHVEVPPGATVPFRFSDPRRDVHSIVVGVKVQFGVPNGYPAAVFENFFWKSIAIPAAPKFDRIGSIHLELRQLRHHQNDVSARWFELAELPR